MLNLQRHRAKDHMSFLQYSPHPAVFYTTESANGRTGLGSGPCASDPGLWNIVYLSCPQVDEFELGTINTLKLPVWSPEFLKPFTDTAVFKLHGTAIGELATTLHAQGFVEYLMLHPDAKKIPLVVKYGMGLLVTMRKRAAKAANIQTGETLTPPGVVVFEPADVNRAKITSMGDWAAALTKGAKH